MREATMEEERQQNHADEVVPAAVMIEDAFKSTPVPSWGQQITVRAMMTSAILSVVFNFIVCKLNLTTGVIPSLNVAAGLLGFALVKCWTRLLEKFGMLRQPFTRQENTVIQTCIVASSGIAFSSGTASYLLGMSPKIAAQADGGNTPANVKVLSPYWMMAFLFAVSFVGLFSIVPLRKMMILKYKLTYPSGTATAYLINSFHTPKGAKLAKKQVAMLFRSFVFSFVWAFFQWFFTAGDGCGFSSFPTFGLQAFKHRFFFDFSTTYVGVGMICPYMVNISLLLGAILSWGIMWPIIDTKKGLWYSADLPESNLHGMNGYRVFIAIAMMLGDGLYHVMYMIINTSRSLAQQHSSKKRAIIADHNDSDNSNAHEEANLDDQRRIEFFLKDEIPSWVAFAGYIALAVIATIVVPFVFHQLKWYHILVAFSFAPILAFCNAYGCGLTDWSLASNYGKLAIIIFSSWVGLENGGIIAGLASCGVMMSTVSTASDLMQDFKTGYLTLSSPRSMFFSQVLGTLIGCILSPWVFWFFYNAYPIGDPEGTYPAPYGLLYRGIALLGVEGINSLPKNCLALSIAFFIAAIVINLLQQVLQHRGYKIHKFIPSPMCMAIPFYLGGYFAIDMCVGSLILFIWELKNKRMATDFAPAVASGLICGDSLWSVPAAILSLVNLKAPMCMKFLSAAANNRVDAFLTEG
ncbi:Oligopeptide transporter [Melia azedarach]|uniref:Oligopeptide transporter n=1 Tax=Melia azedarach TaxID=155640 RepID=A0ACC1XGC8_MELAZ|nr:Oligopeptide transporter [Melia azedarach]